MSRKLPRLTSIDRLTSLALRGMDGATWYSEALPSLQARAAFHGVTLKEYCDLTAITSPRQTVRGNVAIVEHLLTRGKLPPTLPSVVSGLAHYRATGEIRGPKTGPFARALAGDPSAVVLDVWMARGFGIPHSAIGGKAVNRECTRRVTAAADRLGIEPRACQAAIWCALYVDAWQGRKEAIRLADVLQSL